MSGVENRPFRVQAQGDSGNIWIYDDIGYWGITASMFAKELQSLSSAKSITVMVNSPGGDVFDGLAIYNSLRKHPATINMEVDGVAASIASIIVLAGDTVKIAQNASMMIHNPWTLAMGEAKDLRKTADTLDLVRGQLIGTYAEKTGLDSGELGNLMDEETWMTADDAITRGFADEVFNEQRVAASAMRRKFNRSIPDCDMKNPIDLFNRMSAVIEFSGWRAKTIDRDIRILEAS